MTYAALLAQARARRIGRVRCAGCRVEVPALITPRGKVPLADVRPLRGWQRTAPGRLAVVVTADGRVCRANVADDGDVIGWPVHRCG